MADGAAQKKKINWLLFGLIVVSVVIHGMILLHASGKFSFSRMSYIEISVRKNSKPQSRSIPKPKVHQKVSAPRQVPDATIRHDDAFPVKAPEPDNSLQNFLSPDVEPQLSAENIPKDIKLDIHEFELPEIAETGGFGSRMDYLDMVRLKIESRKEYPKISQQRNKEGLVVVEFVIGLDGGVSELKVLSKSGNESLDQAAVLAVEKAAPFARPPKQFFSRPVRVNVPIMFELIQ